MIEIIIYIVGIVAWSVGGIEWALIVVLAYILIQFIRNRGWSDDYR